VALWHWKADLEAPGGGGAVKERAEGWARPVVELPGEAQDVRARGAWKDGRWRVTMSRPLVPRDPSTDLAFEAGRLVPFAVQAWDGSNGEKGLMMSLSSWSFLVLEPPPSRTAYLAPILGVAFTGLFEWWLVRRARRR
jgi:DMSO reductase family type II enzyme heme b subunit